MESCLVALVSDFLRDPLKKGLYFGFSLHYIVIHLSPSESIFFFNCLLFLKNIYFLNGVSSPHVFVVLG